MDEEDKKELAEELGLDEGEAEDVEGQTLELMRDHDVDLDTANRAKELIEDEGLDEDEAVEIAELE